MPIYNCAEYETRILEYDELGDHERVLVDAHVAGCDGCRAFLSALTEVDLTLSQEVRARALAARPPARPPVWPLVLDFAGWASLIAALLVVAIVVAPAELQETACWLVLGGAVVAGSVYFGFQSWREIGG